MNDASGEVRMTLALLAKRAGVTKRHVRRILRELEAAGVIMKISNDLAREASRFYIPTYEQGGHIRPPIHHSPEPQIRTRPVGEEQILLRTFTIFDGMSTNPPTPKDKPALAAEVGGAATG